uniref:P-type ATPase C-terminal domain-containing protein n=1 Tax=Timema douglasi TaxID=61478 RepID=A0A7R8ZBQ2_TIMDO|nr:unnamed protein product [Timema douglasi]
MPAAFVGANAIGVAYDNDLTGAPKGAANDDRCHTSVNVNDGFVPQNNGTGQDAPEAVKAMPSKSLSFNDADVEYRRKGPLGEVNQVRMTSDGVYRVKFAENRVRIVPGEEGGDSEVPRDTSCSDDDFRVSSTGSVRSKRSSAGLNRETLSDRSSVSSSVLNHVDTSAPIGTENLLLRGARLKNTEFVFGCAVYTGQETKLALNSRLTSNKFSTVEKSINGFLLFFMGLLLVEVALCLGLKYYTELQRVFITAEYLGPVPVINFRNVLQDLLSFFILFNYIIPISLYVTIEMQKFLGTLFFEWDEGLFCQETGQAAICNTSDLNEELGQVEYLFTDKTGTLTENNMCFRRCSVSGVPYLESEGRLFKLPSSGEDVRGTLVDTINEEMERFLLGLALCHTVQLSNASKRLTMNNNLTEGDLLSMHLDYQASSPDEKALVEAAARCGVVFVGEKGDTMFVLVKGQLQHFTRLECLEFTSGGYMEETSSVVSWSVDRLPHSGTKQGSSLTLTDYTMALSYKLHHSGNKQGSSLTLTDYTMALSYKLHHSETKQGSSLTLIDYTMALYYKLLHSGTKQGSSLTLTDYTMALYHKLLHSGTKQDRKRMSLVVRDGDGDIWLYCKGAESSVIPLTEKGPTEKTLAHLGEFALRGLRTMVVGYRKLSISQYSSFSRQVGQARQTMSSHRESIIAASYSKMEAGLTLLGATGVEDKLQEGVQETLESLRAAGLKVWILTGDKVETAVNISFSCGHFKPGTVQLFLTEHHKERSCVQMLQAYRSQFIFFFIIDINEKHPSSPLSLARTSLAHCKRAVSLSFPRVTDQFPATSLGTALAAGISNSSLRRTIARKNEKGRGGIVTSPARVEADSLEQYGLVVDGQSLKFALKNQEMFRKVCMACTAVICCRMSPLQKSQVVQLVKQSPNKPITAAIGDGANDVAMIQEAHVGLGIMGKEGRQAVRCSDFAFGQFRFVRRVLLVHGHWYYLRISTLVLYFFYKNIVFITPQLFFNFISAFSTQAIYDTAYLSMYNVLFTSLPILIYGLFEQNYSDVKLLECPHLYKEIANNVLMSWCSFLKWIAFGEFRRFMFSNSTAIVLLI